MNLCGFWGVRFYPWKLLLSSWFWMPVV